MKKRLISAAVGIVLLMIVIYFHETPLLTTVMAVLSGIAVYEILVNTQFIHSKTGGILCAVFAGLSIFIIRNNSDLYFPAMALFLISLIFCMLRFHQQFTFTQLSVCAFGVTAVPLAFSTIFMMLDAENGGIIYLILVCIAAWVTDSAAYFVGTLFGKRKLFPNLSPNKTLEGVIGGLVATGIIFTIICYGYWKKVFPDAEISLLHTILIGVICAFSGMAGDLFASAIKRQSGIKDFGFIMPGHGGVMDRFDSFLFVAPVLFYLISNFPIFIY